MEALVERMLDGQILLNEALEEFEKVFIERALERNGDHISKTAEMLGLHRNTVAKRLARYNGSTTPTKARVRKNGPSRSRRKRP